MNKIVAVLLMIVVMCTGCGSKVERTEEPDDSMFVVVEGTNYWYIVYDKETKVMYEVSRGMYNIGTFTMLVDADGKPKLWEGK